MKRKKGLKVALVSILSILILLVASFFIYTSIYYEADDMAREMLINEDNIEVRDDFYIITSDKDSDTALIFYPGAKVESISYLPLLEKISKECNITCILVDMPFNLAVFNSDAADEIINSYSSVSSWYIGGHSMGGAMASSYASKNKDSIDGLILLGAYIYGDYRDEDTLTIYGSLNESVGEKIDYSNNVVVIDGGNHAQFGNYGKQKGDDDATISREKQQDITVKEIKKFLDERSK